MTLNKADEKALGGLHGKLAEVLKDALSQDYGTDDLGIEVPLLLQSSTWPVSF